MDGSKPLSWRSGLWRDPLLDAGSRQHQ